MKGRGSKKTYIIIALLAIILVSVVYLSKQSGLREGMVEGKKREPFKGREALDAGCYSNSNYLGTGSGILDCRKNYPNEKNVTYKSK